MKSLTVLRREYFVLLAVPKHNCVHDDGDDAETANVVVSVPWRQ